MGELETSLREKVHSLGLDNAVIFTGGRSDVDALLSAIDVFVFPSLWEGLPVTVVEAQAAGLPCLISDRVTKEIVITNLVDSLPLTPNISGWVDDIMQKKGVSRLKEVQAEVASAGYDIEKSSLWLKNFYLEHWSN